MTDEKHSQLSTLNSPLVPPGYKQTEVGVIPEDWRDEPLGKHVRITSGTSPSLIEFTGSGYPYFKVDQLGNSDKYLRNFSTPYHFAVGSTVPAGSIIFAKRGAAISLNRVRIIAQDSFMDTNLMTLTPDDEIEGEFLFYVLGHIGLWKLADTTSVPQINNKHINPLFFPIPEIPEQRAIATALSDVDALLEGLDRLIAKKRDLKQAAMQQLLTGKTRLPGFEGEWEVKRLGEIAEFCKGKGLPKSAIDPYASEPCVHYGELFTLYSEEIRETISRTADAPDHFRSKANDVLMPTSDVTPRGLAKASCVLSDDVVLGGDILIIRTDPQCICGVFLSHVIRREEAQVLRLVTGTTVFHLYGTDMAKFVVVIPPIDEQKAIITLLSDMDAEIEALEKRRAKTHDLKQAMMQELLTGKTRLI